MSYLARLASDACTSPGQRGALQHFTGQGLQLTTPVELSLTDPGESICEADGKTSRLENEKSVSNAEESAPLHT